jgi:hypothetical protein
MGHRMCRECHQLISEEAKTCPRCGVSRPVVTRDPDALFAGYRGGLTLILVLLAVEIAWIRHQVKQLAGSPMPPAVAAVDSFLPHAPITAGPQQRPSREESSKPVPRPQAWIGCWVLQATRDKVTRLDTVRLQNVVVPGRDRRTQYRGSRMLEKPQHYSGSIFWSLDQKGDSAEIRVESLGGTVWRVVQDRDSLVGYAYATFDIVPGEHPFGPATGRRLKC